MSSSAGRVLVVDDDFDTRRIFQKALSLGNFEVQVAANGKEAWEILAGSSCPDVVLLDLSMPEMSGAEFIEQLKTHQNLSKVKVAIVSGWDKLEVRAAQLGAHGFIRKPADLAGLQNEVKRLITMV